MINLSVEKMQGSPIVISPMSIKRDWMDVTPQGHAYRCFPVTQANMVGWSLSCEDDIKFIWNGINDTSSENIKILDEKPYMYTGRGQSTISFSTGLVFKSDENTSLLTINPVNFFNEDFETMSSVVSTSFYPNPIPLAIKARVANKEIVITAGTALATIIPVSLTMLNNTEIVVNQYTDKDRVREQANKEYGEAAQKINQAGQWTDWYRDAVNEKNETVGRHEAKTLKLSVIDKALTKTVTD
jgi:hypothetical protein